MTKISPVAALAGCTVALAVAALINTGITLAAGDTLVIPGELGIVQVVIFTLVMIIPATIVLWLLPRWFPIIALVAAVATTPVPYMEFAESAPRWLAPMHLVAGICAALLGPRVAKALQRGR